MKRLGRTDLEISPIIYGCMGSAGAFGTQIETDSIEALQNAFGVGINCFDTAEMYGNGYSEQLINKALSHVRQDIVIIDKVSPDHMHPQQIKEACERSLRNLGTDYIDLYLLHWPVHDVPIEDRLEALNTLKEEGKIRYFGVSNFGLQNLNEIEDTTPIMANEVAYNLLVRAPEFEVIPRCVELEIPILCYSSLMQGLLAGKYQSLDDFPENRARTKMFDSRTHAQCRHGGFGAEKEGSEALKKIWNIVRDSGLTMEALSIGWLKAQKGVGGVIVGTRNGAQSTALKPLLDNELDSSLIDELTRATDLLKTALGSGIDMWDHRSK